MTDEERIEEVFEDLATLDKTEEGTEQENTWYFVLDEEGQQNFNYLPTEYYILVNIWTRAEFKGLIDNEFRKKLQLKGLNLIYKAYNDNNKQGELRISSFRCI